MRLPNGKQLERWTNRRLSSPIQAAVSPRHHFRQSGMRPAHCERLHRYLRADQRAQQDSGLKQHALLHLSRDDDASGDCGPMVWLPVKGLHTRAARYPWYDKSHHKHGALSNKRLPWHCLDPGERLLDQQRAIQRGGRLPRSVLHRAGAAGAKAVKAQV